MAQAFELAGGRFSNVIACASAHLRKATPNLSDGNDNDVDAFGGSERHNGPPKFTNARPTARSPRFEILEQKHLGVQAIKDAFDAPQASLISCLRPSNIHGAPIMGIEGAGERDPSEPSGAWMDRERKRAR